MTKENGGIWLMPGSHKKKFRHINDGNHTVAQTNGAKETFIDAEIGDIVLFSSKLLHSTTPNTTQESRWVYVIEYMKVGHIDPFIEPPYLIIAKDGKPALRYVDELSGDDKIINKIKYFRANYNGQTYKAKQKKQRSQSS